MGDDTRVAPLDEGMYYATLTQPQCANSFRRLETVKYVRPDFGKNAEEAEMAAVEALFSLPEPLSANAVAAEPEPEPEPAISEGVPGAASDGQRVVHMAVVDKPRTFSKKLNSLEFSVIVGSRSAPYTDGNDLTKVLAEGQEAADEVASKTLASAKRRRVVRHLDRAPRRGRRRPPRSAAKEDAHDRAVAEF